MLVSARVWRDKQIALSILKPGSPLTGRVHAKSHPFKKMKREIAAVVVLCAACVEGANRLDGHKGKHTLTLSVRDRTPEKKKGKEAGDVEEQSSERKSTRGPAEREFFSEESAFAPSLRQKRMKIAQGTRVATLVKRAVPLDLELQTFAYFAVAFHVQCVCVL